MKNVLSLTLSQFAVKEFKIRKDSAVDYKRELENLAITNHLKHPNIVELLGSYTYDGRHNLLFPLADTGNLAQLLDTERRLTMFLTDEALVIVLAALASAVEHVHDFTERKIDLDLIGCHHDLRPRNILVSGSSLILADFGLTTFKPAAQNSATPFESGMDDYLAPDDPIHRSSDIRSLGCIVAEVTTYMDLGRDGVQHFRRVREHKVSGIITLHQFHQGSVQPSSAVNDWLSKGSKSSSTSCVLSIPLVRDMLCLDQSKRPKAKEITWRLRLTALYSVHSWHSQ
jgi:serine/threonine protein kinase